MSHSHHSHSGQFCPGHAANTLEECIQTAISRNLTVFGLSEHMPRHFVDMYPEELASGTTYEWHLENEAAYFKEAQRLRSKYASQIEIVVGFESDWIRPESQELIERSIMMYDYDYFVGSVHHVHTVPIDYDQGMYDEARTRAGGTDERLFEDYFDAQFEMLKAVRPPVVGHFDLIRLKSQDPDVSGGWKSVGDCWGQIVRNLDLIREYGGTIEVNTAALRKGMKEPYPKRDVIEVSLAATSTVWHS
jgi:histidinol-phosphatase (PHP family)